MLLARRCTPIITATVLLALSAAARASIPGDFNTDGLVDETDWLAFGVCLTGPWVADRQPTANRRRAALRRD